MKPWRRCPDSSFYKQGSSRDYYDKRVAFFDAAYVDPIDYILVRTIPWREDYVQILMWQIRDINEKALMGMADEQVNLMMSWSERVTREMARGPDVKEVLLEDLDVDLHSRDLLLDTIELFINVSPPQDTHFRQTKVLRNRKALEEALRLLGVGAC